MLDCHKSLSNQEVIENDKTDLAENLALILVKHPELVQVVDRWPKLPEHIRAVIGLLIERG
jgi:hypothetical protein